MTTRIARFALILAHLSRALLAPFGRRMVLIFAGGAFIAASLAFIAFEENVRPVITQMADAVSVKATVLSRTASSVWAQATNQINQG